MVHFQQPAGGPIIGRVSRAGVFVALRPGVFSQVRLYVTLRNLAEISVEAERRNAIGFQFLHQFFDFIS